MKYLGIDFGLRRVGLAASDGILASPLKTLKVKSFTEAIDKVVETVRKEKFDKIVIGLPEGKMGKTVSGFSNLLKKMGLDVETADETLSSQKAMQQMIELNVPKRDRRISDAYSATIILQSYLDLL